jgi:hypothetical protein
MERWKDNIKSGRSKLKIGYYCVVLLSCYCYLVPIPSSHRKNVKNTGTLHKINLKLSAVRFSRYVLFQTVFFIHVYRSQLL